MLRTQPFNFIEDQINYLQYLSDNKTFTSPPKFLVYIRLQWVTFPITSKPIGSSRQISMQDIFNPLGWHHQIFEFFTDPSTHRQWDTQYHQCSWWGGRNSKEYKLISSQPTPGLVIYDAYSNKVVQTSFQHHRWPRSHRSAKQRSVELQWSNTFNMKYADTKVGQLLWLQVQASQ